jgi:hypothetical protein
MKDSAMKVAVILDRSGSMSKIAEATVEGMNAFIAEQQKTAGEVALLLAQFDDHYERVYEGPMATAPYLTLKDQPGKQEVRYVPRASTALLDAIGRTIEELGNEFSAMAETERPAKVVVVIMTDGLENASKSYNMEKVSELISQQREVYKWQFQFLGANQDAIATAARMNIPSANSMSFFTSAVGTRSAMRAASRNVRNYGATGQSACMDYMAEDRAQAMEPDMPESGKIVPEPVAAKP